MGLIDDTLKAAHDAIHDNEADRRKRIVIAVGAALLLLYLTSSPRPRRARRRRHELAPGRSMSRRG